MSFARQHVHQQSTDHVPLETAGVLKLINEHMLVTNTRFLEDKVRVTLAERFAERAGSTGE